MALSVVAQARGLEETRASEDERVRLLQRVQPGLSGLIDGSLSSLAPIFAVVMSTHKPGYAFVAGLATAIGAAISMAFSEGLSDTGTLTERGNAWKRGGVVGGGTFLGGILHTVPFLIPYYLPALAVALAVVVVELLALAWLRHRFFDVSFAGSLATVTLGGLLISGVGIGLGALLGTSLGG